MLNMFRRRISCPIVLGALLSTLCLNGCAALAIALIGAAAGAATETAVSYSINGIAARTLTSPLPRVRRAALTALRRMGIRVKGRENIEEGEIIKAEASDRLIEIRLERVSNTSTRIRTVARHGFFLTDRATAVEIIQQTERVLNGKT